jgi:GntR family transcriptional regulator
MDIHITPSDGVPIYLQIVGQVKYLVASGRLAPGEELPPIRTLAERLLINPNTVARAYRELEVAGLVETRGRGGTVVTGAGDVHKEAARAAASVYVAQTRRLGLEPEEIVALVRAAVDAASPAPG